jgi:hypothetical protein
LTIEQFETLKVMIHDLMNEKRPSCEELLASPKYKPFFGDRGINYKWVVIAKESRYVPKKSGIESALAKKVRRESQRTKRKLGKS